MKRYSNLVALLVTLMSLVSLLPVAASSNNPASIPPRSFSQRVDVPPLLDEGPSRLTSREDVLAPNISSWSKLVFQSLRDDNWEIYLADANGSNQTRLTNHAASDADPRLNPGCTRVAFDSFRTGNWEIFTMNPDGSGLVQLTYHGAEDYNPIWSPDGTKIAFNSFRDGQSEIYVMNADGSAKTRLTANGAYDGIPTWSPDGAKIAFVSNRAGTYHIWVMNADGSGVKQLSTQTYSLRPTWSPDGSRIAYDADGDGDGWQELWIMNADGTNQHQAYKASSNQTDTWARSWSPDGNYVAFTRIFFVYYEGNWYWTDAYLDAWNSTSGGITALSHRGYDWHPDWQTTDGQAPTSNVAALPLWSTSTFTVTWSGADQGPSGLLNYDVQIREGAAGVWTDWQIGVMITSTTYTGIGGEAYYFRSRARDNAGNVEPWPTSADTSTVVESSPPRTHITSLPAYHRGDLIIQWGGEDPGDSGIKNYDVEYKEDSGNWIAWQTEVTQTHAGFSGTPGHTYYFRSRARDYAQNVESWSAEDGDTSTTLYTWGVMGTVRDNTGAPIMDAVATITPEAFAALPSDREGAYATYSASSAESYAVVWSKPGYGELPSTEFSAHQNASVDVILPPENNLVRNWGFESEGTGVQDWIEGGAVSPIVTNIKHTGEHAISMGQEMTFTSPISLSRASENDKDAESPQLAVGTEGVVHAVWEDTTPGVVSIYYAQRNIDGTWSAPQHISAGTDPAQDSRIAIDREGNIHVLWHAGDYGDRKIYYAQRGSDGVWSEPQSITDDSGNIQYGSQKLAVDGNGHVHIAWQNDQDELYYTQRKNDGTWVSPEFVVDGYYLSSIELAVEESGLAHLAWEDCHWENGGIYYAQRDEEGDWTVSPNLFLDGTEPQLSVGKDGSVHLIWEKYTSDYGTRLYYMWRENNSTWFDPQLVSDDTAGWSPQLEADIDEKGNGTVHSVWIYADGYDTSSYEVYYAQRNSAGSWSTPQNISNNDTRSRMLHLAIDNIGLPHVAWLDGEYSAPEVYYARKKADGVWLEAQNISHMPHSGVPKMVVDEGRNPHIAWANLGYTGTPEIYYAGPALAMRTEDCSIMQAVTLPPTMTHPVLSFLYQLNGQSVAPDAGLSVQVNDGITATTLFSTAAGTAGWQHHWLDLTPWTNQTLTLTFNVHQQADLPKTQVYLDEISVGSAHADVWVTKHTSTTVTGHNAQVNYTLAYGNQGSMDAENVQILDFLPDGISLVAADPAPVLDTVLGVWAWNVGDLAAQSGPFHIALTTTLMTTVTAGNHLTNTVRITTASSELETANNESQVAIFVSNQVYLPLVTRNYFE